jgi:copper chaperone NosL
MSLQKISRGKTTVVLCIVVMSFFFAVAAVAAAPKPIKPGAKDKCPVCGMFVAKYPDFATQIQFRDGTRVFFDGVKDMLKYYRNLSRFDPARKQTNILAVYVTDYYSLGYVDGYKAFYVSGSDVFGPMGKELVPFEKKSDAQEFLKDHKGRSLLTFQEISDTVMKSLE